MPNVLFKHVETRGRSIKLVFKFYNVFNSSLNSSQSRPSIVGLQLSIRVVLVVGGFPFTLLESINITCLVFRKGSSK